MKISTHKTPPAFKQKQRKPRTSKYIEAYDAMANLSVGEWLKIEIDNEMELRRLSQSLRKEAKRLQTEIKIIRPDREKRDLWIQRISA